MSGNRRNRQTEFFVFAIVDLLAVLLGLFLAYLFRFEAGIVDVTKGYSRHSYIGVLPLALIVWVFWLDNSGCYNFRERAFNLQIMKKLVRANALAVITLVAIHFFQRSLEFSRLVYIMSFITCCITLGGFRFVLDRVLAYMRHARMLRSTRVAILGTGQLGGLVADRIRSHTLLGFQMIGFFSVHPEDVGRKFAGFPIIGDMDSIREAIQSYEIDELIVADPEMAPNQILEFIVECEKEFVNIRVAPNLLEALLVEMSVEQIDGIPLFGLKESPLQGWNVVLKRTFDILVSLVGLVVLSPFLALLALLVKLSSPGPVLYKQERVGIDNKKFKMLKFRSMRMDAEADGPQMARPDDERVTGLGRIMRRTNLDELPQLWNVLRGDMSLVGPRPERPYFVRSFRDQIPRYMRRHRVKSGITGWAQVNGLRGNTSIEDRIKLDLYYIENWSIWLDVKILLMTFRAHENAY